MNCWNLWKLGASRFYLKLATLKIDLNTNMFVQCPDPSGPRYVDPPPVLRHWQLVLNYFRY